MKKLLFFAIAAILFAACQKEAKKSVEGSWELVSVETKSVNYGSVQVSVYLDFSADGTFNLYQKVGAGRYRLNTGNYTYLDGILSGKYSDGSAWGGSYEVSFGEDDTMTLSQTSGTEQNVYRKSTIPQSVISDTF